MCGTLSHGIGFWAVGGEIPPPGCRGPTCSAQPSFSIISQEPAPKDIHPLFWRWALWRWRGAGGSGARLELSATLPCAVITDPWFLWSTADYNFICLQGGKKESTEIITSIAVKSQGSCGHRRLTKQEIHLLHLGQEAQTRSSRK